MFRKFRIRKKAKIAIKLLKEYFKYKDMDVYKALCNCKRRDITIAEKKYVDDYVCNEFDFTILSEDKTTLLDSRDGFIYKSTIADQFQNYERVVNFHKLIGLDNNTMCTWDMIIDYLKSE